jgi:beta-glucanase (GH16 family)
MLLAGCAVLLLVPQARAENPTSESSKSTTAPPSAGASNENRAPSDKAAEYQLVWSDEFNQDGRPDPKNWTYEHGFVRNHEAQWYQPENARCENGLLIIEARREKFKNPNYDASANSQRWQRSREYADYTSCSMTTRGLHEWTYGRFEMRGRIDTSAGLWPAWWTLGRGRWPAAGEIDIMEYYRGILKANIAWAGEQNRGGATWNSAVRQISRFPADWSSKFHIWRMDWDENDIKLYVDDMLLNDQDLTKTIDNDARKTNPFVAAPQYMILNVAVGGDNGGDPSQTTFPSKMEVDYVRVYQKHAADRINHETGDKGTSQKNNGQKTDSPNSDDTKG